MIFILLTEDTEDYPISRRLHELDMTGVYRATEKLMDLVSEDMLTWKPNEGEN